MLMAKYKHYTLYLSPDIDGDVIKILDKCKSKTALIRKAIRKQVGKEQEPNKNPDISYWVRIRLDRNHFAYECERCKAVQKYKKTPYCPICGRVMELDITYNEKGEIV